MHSICFACVTVSRSYDDELSYKWLVEEQFLLQGCGFDTVGSGVAYNNASDFLMYFTQACLHTVVPTAVC